MSARLAERYAMNAMGTSSRACVAGAVPRRAVRFPRAASRSFQGVASAPRPVARREGRDVHAKAADVALLAAADYFVEETGPAPEKLVIAVALFLGLGTGLGIPIFYNFATKTAEERPNTQTCFVCDGTGVNTCRFCEGTGVLRMVLATGEVDESECVNCSGKGTIVCTTCNGTGVQPRYLDRREFEDDD